jgi:hypothetical protein
LMDSSLRNDGMLGLLNTLFFQQIGRPGDRRWNPSRFTVVDSTLARQSRDRTNEHGDSS